MDTQINAAIIASIPKKTLRKWLDENQIPYILCSVKCKKGKKEIRKNTIPKGWKEWDYKECDAYNRYKADPKCSVMNINLYAGGYVVVDIDDAEKAVELIEEYTSTRNNITYSINRKLPHIWMKRCDDDKWSTQTKVKNEAVDYLYHNVFESIDSEIQNYDENFDDFDWEHYLGNPPPPTQAATKSLITDKDTRLTHPLLDMINVKYWTNYSDWLKLIWAIDECFEKPEQVAIHYSKKSPAFTTEEIVIEKMKSKNEEGKLTWGTIRYYAKESSPEEYEAYNRPSIRGNDETLAALFLYAFGKNIMKTEDDDTYIYREEDGLWEKQTSPYLMRFFLSQETRKIIDADITAIELKMDTFDVMSSDYENLEKRHKELMDMRNRLLANSGITNIHAKLKDLLSRGYKRDIQFDIGENNYYNIQFKNGVYNLKDNTFRPRCKTDYITKTLDWDYKEERNEENIKIIDTFFKKVQPNDDDRIFTTTWLANCLDGNIKKELFKMNIGSGSNGKTQEFTIFAKCFKNYSLKMNSDALSTQPKNRDKELTPLADRPIRFLYIEEIPRKNLDVDFVKELVSGEISVKPLYKEAIVVRTQATINTCSQHDPNGKADGGILRRGCLQYYPSKFLDDVEDNYEKKIFKKEDGFDTRFNDDEMKLAFFHYLLGYYKPLVVPQKIKNNFKNVLEDNDNFKSTFDLIYEITDDREDKIGKQEVINDMSAHGVKGWNYILQEFKRLGIEYNRKMKVNYRLGGFHGIRKLPQIDVEDSEPDY